MNPITHITEHQHEVDSNNSYTPGFKYHYETNSLYDLSTKLVCKNSYEAPKITSLIVTSTVGEATGPIIRKGKWMPVKKSKLSEATTKKPENLHLTARRALSLLLGTTINERKYRVSRPSLGVRSGKLAAYKVTLQKKKMFFFLERFLEAITKENASLTSGSNKGAWGVKHKDGFPQIELKENIRSKKKKASDFINDGSSNKKVISTYFDGNGNFHYGVPSFFIFREIEQNPEFEALKNHGFSITIKTTAKTDQEARLLLSSWGFPWSLAKHSEST